jgi:hypothetical protein
MSPSRSRVDGYTHDTAGRKVIKAGQKSIKLMSRKTVSRMTSMSASREMLLLPTMRREPDIEVADHLLLTQLLPVISRKFWLKEASTENSTYQANSKTVE